jgi:hypothetical protein
MSSMNGTKDSRSAKPAPGRRRERDIGRDIEDYLEPGIGDYIREEPLTALAIAGAAGFILGGGANSRIGLAALAMVGKVALRGAATNFIVGLFVRNQDQKRSRSAKSSGKNQEEQRTDRPDRPGDAPA